MSIQNLLRLTAVAFAFVAFTATQASAQDVTAEVSVARDVDDLRDEIRIRHPDIDVADTLLIFTNTQTVSLPVRCIAYNRAGNAIGRTRTDVPPNGARYIRASDLSNGLDFIGHAVCTSPGNFLPSAIFLGPGIVNLKVDVTHEGPTRLRFPVVATY